MLFDRFFGEKLFVLNNKEERQYYFEHASKKTHGLPSSLKRRQGKVVFFLSFNSHKNLNNC